jgi:MYXO-CTERM domain-containing protein
MFPFDPLDFLMNCDCSIGHAGAGTPALTAALMLFAFAFVLVRRRPRR